MNTLLKFFFVFLLFSVFASCSKDDTPDVDTSIQFSIDKQKIRDYLNENNLEADSTPEGLFYIIDYTNDTLDDIKATATSIVTVDYKGYLLDGKVFDSNYNVIFPLSNVIQGWRIGIPLLKQGESARFFIPSKLAYGSSESASIPANSPLIFEVSLIKVQ